MWIAITSETVIPEGELLGFNKKWIDEDFNPDGVCICFKDDICGWCISKWCGQHDEWHTRVTEIDAVLDENMPAIDPPTHYMLKPKNPFQCGNVK